MKFTNKDILEMAMQQSAVDANCSKEDFLRKDNIIVTSKSNPGARKYLKLPLDCNLISYGNNIVATINEKYRDIVSAYVNRYPVEHCFETPNMHVLNDAMQKDNLRVCFMAEYFLPDLTCLKVLDCTYELRVLQQEDFASLYTEEWSNALCEKRKELDVLGVGAYDGDRLIGLAGCSADCETMWQIGVDVLSEYRRQGVASALTSRLAIEILNRGKVPFYCAAWSNIKSVRNAIKSGFRPAWVEMTVKSTDLVNEMNGITYEVKKLPISELHTLTQLFDYNDVEEMIAENTREIENKSIDIFVVYLNKQLVGELHVVYEKEDKNFAERDKRAYLFAFRVHEEYQNQGIGKYLLEKVLDTLKTEGCTEFTVGVEDDNLRAKYIYQKYGFTKVIARKSESYQGDSYEYDLWLRN